MVCREVFKLRERSRVLILSVGAILVKQCSVSCCGMRGADLGYFGLGEAFGEGRLHSPLADRVLRNPAGLQLALRLVTFFQRRLN